MLQKRYNEKIVTKAIMYKQVYRGLTAGEIQELFDLQTLIDDSEDTPVLFNSAEDKFPVVEIKDGSLTLEAAYTISSDISEPNNPDKRSMLIIKGVVGSGNNGLSNEAVIEAVGDTAAIKRLKEAFGVEEGEDLTVATFLKEMLEASLASKVSIEKMWLAGDELGIYVSRKSVDEIS